MENNKYIAFNIYGDAASDAFSELKLNNLTMPVEENANVTITSTNKLIYNLSNNSITNNVDLNINSLDIKYDDNFNNEVSYRKQRYEDIKSKLKLYASETPISVTDEFGNTMESSTNMITYPENLSDASISQIFSDYTFESEEDFENFRLAILAINENNEKDAKDLLAELLDELVYNADKSLNAWDPRLYRLDSFLMSGASGTTNNTSDQAVVTIPFSSDMVTSMFYDMVFKLEPEVMSVLLSGKNRNGETLKGIFLPNDLNNDFIETDGLYELAKTDSKLRRAKVPFNAKRYNRNGDLLGSTSLMNPYSITRLCGSFSNLDNAKTGTPDNYMYDVRDQRRFYGNTDAETRNTDASSGVASTGTATQVASPTVTHIIEWANKDRWGRTPYSFLDFVYCKWFGKIPNNRLITLRRYHAPTHDNLLFESMFNDSFSADDKNDGVSNDVKAFFAPRCTVISYIGEETGNTFSGLMKFTTGIPWGDAKADIWKVEGDEGDDHQATIDSLFENGSPFTAENTLIGNFGKFAGNQMARVMSFGKLWTASTGKVGLTDTARKKLMETNMDPYNDGTYANRILGPINRIDSTKRRTEGIVFESSYQVKCTYVTKSIGGINPKAAMLDILSNCMEMVSPTAVFWGGGHRFNITPHYYPFHDGGWRDNFMEKLYLGKIFGSSGAVATTLKGLREFGEDAAGGFNWDNMTESLGRFMGEGLAALSGMISSISSALFGEGSNLLTEAAAKASELVDGAASSVGGSSDEQKRSAAKAKVKGAMSNLFGNLETMWHSKVLAASTAPKIENMHSLMTGAPVGEWHLTVGNPLNPVMVIGNLICEKMEVEWGEELGPDDFPTELTVTYSLLHGQARDKNAIQSMFNRGMGQIYDLPDYIKSSSEFETAVDAYTGGVGFREPKFEHTGSIRSRAAALGYTSKGTYYSFNVSKGFTPKTYGSSDTRLITKFNLAALSYANTNLNSLSSLKYVTPSTMPVIKSMAITRKYTS